MASTRNIFGLNAVDTLEYVSSISDICTAGTACTLASVVLILCQGLQHCSFSEHSQYLGRQYRNTLSTRSTKGVYWDPLCHIVMQYE